jgi:predicted GNAT family acetyltransferase
MAQGRAATSVTGQWKVVDGLNRELYRFRPAENTRAKANELASLWARENNFDGNYQVEPAEDTTTAPTPDQQQGGLIDISGSTNDLARQRATPGTFTCAWKIIDNDGNEMHRFSGIGNNQRDANRVATQWVQNNGYAYGTEIEVVPIMSESIAEGADKKYTIKKSYTMSKAGVEKSVWHIMDGDFVVDVTDLRRDAKYYADKWNAAEKESSNASQNQHKQDVTEGSENFNGIDISMEKEDDEIMVRATAGGQELGHVLFVEEGEYLAPQDLEVEERFQGQGIAAAMYDYVKSKGYKIRRSGQQTDAGAGFWDKHKSGKNVWEQGVAEGIEFFAMPLRMSEYRGKAHPATNEPYDSKFKFSGDLTDRVHGLLDAGTKPTLLQVNPRHLLATQDWLSTQGGGKPPFATMKQHPVVLQKNNKMYILDGHHRSAAAYESGSPIEVYLFRDEL